MVGNTKTLRKQLMNDDEALRRLWDNVVHLQSEVADVEKNGSTEVSKLEAVSSEVGAPPHAKMLLNIGGWGLSPIGRSFRVVLCVRVRVRAVWLPSGS